MALKDGDLRWVFDEARGSERDEALLDEAAGSIERIAQLFAGRAGWTGSGLEFHRLPGGEWHPPRTDLVGFAEGRDSVCFWVEVVPDSGGWTVDAEINVRCDADADYGTHTVESFPLQTSGDKTETLTYLAAAAAWLETRATAEPPEHWRAADAQSRHN